MAQRPPGAERFEIGFARQPGVTYEIRILDARNLRSGGLWAPFVGRVKAAAAGADDQDRLLGTFTSVGRATLKGTLVIGIVQGGLAGLAFWAAGIDGALERVTPLPYSTFHDLEVTEDGILVLLDRFVRRSLVLVNEAGTVLGEHPVEGPGVNEAGLVMSTMSLNQTQLPRPDARPVLDSGNWIQYLLDTCATVDEVLATDDVVRNLTVDHYLVADRSGGSAVIEPDPRRGDWRRRCSRKT